MFVCMSVDAHEFLFELFVGLYAYCMVLCNLFAGAAPRSFVWVDGFIGTQTHLPPKFSFFSDFGHFILKMVVNSQVSRKKILKYQNFWGGGIPR